MINLKKLIISILIPNALGIIGTLLGNSKMGFYQTVKPFYSPPGYIFPIVWILLYTLMGFSSYLIFMSESKRKNQALKTYFVQLLINCTWPFFFFNLKWYLFSFIWILIMISIVILMTYQFIKINKLSGYLQIPYILWLIFASILNFSIYILN